ncbi:hypothetical protein C2E23DRAFT_807252 [Lenzites betulinus]|nr:hypothetical protein C2E23DRAFT_807252 [Lenzites betulinus]
MTGAQWQFLLLLAWWLGAPALAYPPPSPRLLCTRTHGRTPNRVYVGYRAVHFTPAHDFRTVWSRCSRVRCASASRPTQQVRGLT